MALARKTSTPHVSSDEFSDLEFIDKGSYGIILKCTYKNKTAVIKIFDSEINDEFSDELAILEKQNATPHSDQFLKLHGYGQSDVNQQFFPYITTYFSYIVTEYMDVGSLDTLLRKQPIEWSTTLEIARDTAALLADLHSLNIIHRDIKSGNIFLSKKNATQFTVKIGDFGFANSKNLQAGSPYWMPPESFIKTTKHGPASDVYSFGVTLIELANPAFFEEKIINQIEPIAFMWQHHTSSPDKPSNSMLSLFKAIDTIEASPDRPTKQVDEYKALVKSCINYVPTARPSIQEVCKSLSTLLALNEKKSTDDKPSTALNGLQKPAQPLSPQIALNQFQPVSTAPASSAIKLFLLNQQSKIL